MNNKNDNHNLLKEELLNPSKKVSMTSDISKVRRYLDQKKISHKTKNTVRTSQYSSSTEFEDIRQIGAELYERQPTTEKFSQKTNQSTC